MDWNLETEENETKKNNKGKKTAKILLVFIVLIFIVMALMLFLLYYVNNNTFRLTIDNKQINNYASDLIVTDNNVQYISLKDFASLVGYKYHNGEYKEYSQYY